MRIILCDQAESVVQAWEKYIIQPNVEIKLGNILNERADAIISPGNSLGIMSGGIDLALRIFFGPLIEVKVQTAILARENVADLGHLHVGCAVWVRTGYTHIPWLIYAPTMVEPVDVSKTHNAFRALSVALGAARYLRLTSVLCPGLCSMNGGMDHDEMARQMKAAIEHLL